MKQTKAEWLLAHWKDLLFVLFIIFVVLVAIPGFVYHLAKIDPELKNVDLRNELKEKLTKEIKGLQLPEKTAVNKFQSNSKDFSILVSTRYRTELGRQEFVGYLTQKLEENGWTAYHGKYSTDYNFCRDNQQASLNYEGQGGLFGDGGNYYNLDFSVGLGDHYDNSRPQSCR